MWPVATALASSKISISGYISHSFRAGRKVQDVEDFILCPLWTYMYLCQVSALWLKFLLTISWPMSVLRWIIPLSTLCLLVFFCHRKGGKVYSLEDHILSVPVIFWPKTGTYWKTLIQLPKVPDNLVRSFGPGRWWRLSDKGVFDLSCFEFLFIFLNNKAHHHSITFGNNLAFSLSCLASHGPKSYF